LGKFKDEYSSKLILEFVAPRPKSYALRVKLLKMDKSKKTYIFDERGEPVWEVAEDKRAKGVGKVTTQKRLEFKDFLNVTENFAVVNAKMKSFRIFKHNIYTIEMQKRALVGINTKRFCTGPTTTLAFGHKDCALYDNYTL